MHQAIHNIAQLCAEKGITKAVISPGSRSAPLTLAFSRHPDIACYIIPDERTASFFALGMAQSTGETIALICTSGSAAYNYAPGIAEAFYSQVPLLILTADRPWEWIDQNDGQTIHQDNIYGKHVKSSIRLPDHTEHPDAEYGVYRAVNQAINSGREFPMGPVHINIPLREPLYPQGEINFGKVPLITAVTAERHPTEKEISGLKESMNTHKKILIVPGQGNYSEETIKLLSGLSEKGFTVVGDIISNTHDVSSIIQHQDLFLGLVDEKQKELLQPDLLITFGRSVISKNLKLFLRTHRPKNHFHIQPDGEVADPMMSLTHVIRWKIEDFLSVAEKHITNIDNAYRQSWIHLNRKTKDTFDQYNKEHSFGEMKAIAHLMHKLPAKSNLHLSNSMAVRYANAIGLKKTETRVWCNRGTSGIDGSTSTMIGHAVADPTFHYLITGDVAFLYDRNAFWHNHLPENIKILVLNNHGGGIFRMIDGPARQPELRKYFETEQNNTAAFLAEEYGFIYLTEEGKNLEGSIDALIESKTRTILEVFTDSPDNAALWSGLKSKIKNNLI